MSQITAERIREVKGNLSQEEFAQSINSSQPVISKILNGETVSVNILQDIARRYKVSVDWLLGISERKSLYGSSLYDGTNPITYADVIALFVTLLKYNSISFHRVRNEDDENSFYQNELPEKDIIEIKDRFIGDLLLSADVLLATSPETIESWQNKVLEEYSILLRQWGEAEEIIYANGSKYKSSLEILKDISNRELQTV